ncbi:MAG: hypothetical protein ACXVB5_20830 [Isosphaeraceae bacterium]
MRHSRAWLAAAILVFSVLALYYARSYPVLQDDAYISLRYADNLVHGHGLTFNPAARVEGYSDFLWVLLMAGALKVSIDPLIFVKVAGFLSGLLLIVATWRFSETFSEMPPHLRIAAPIAGVAGPIAFASIGGLETAPFALLILLAAYRYLKECQQPNHLSVSPLIFLAAALMRVDGVLFFAMTAGHLLTTRLANRTVPGRRDLSYLALFVVPFIVYWVWRSEYYGYLLPNTFYAKTGLSFGYIIRGVKYLVDFLPLYGGPLLIFVPLLILKNDRWSVHGYLLTLIAGWCVYTIWIGGDGLVMFRFVAPIIAPAAFLMQEATGQVLSVGGLPSRLRRLRLTAPMLEVASCIGMLAIVGVGWLHSSAVSAMKANSELDQSRVEMGKWLGQEAKPGDTLAVAAAGAIPYFSGLPTIDMLGLNDVHIAHKGGRDTSSGAGHDRFDTNYVLSQSPTFIVLSPMYENGSDLDDATIPAVKSILQSEDFQENYERLSIPSLGKHEVLFARHDRVSSLSGVKLVTPAISGGRYAMAP